MNNFMQMPNVLLLHVPMNNVENIQQPLFNVVNVNNRYNLTPNINANQIVNQVGVGNVQKEQCNGTESINAMILIKFWNIDGIYQFIDTNCHTIYYYTRKVINGKVKVGIDYNSILKTFSGIKFMNVITIKDKTKEEIDRQEKDLKKEGNKLNMLSFDLKTNGKSENTIVLSCQDEEKVERFKTSFKLRDSKTKWRNLNEMKIINDFIEKFKKVPKKSLNHSFRFGLNVMFETLNLEKMKEESNENTKYLEEVNEKIYENPENETYEVFRDTIFDKDKNDDKEKELLILCFDSLYKFIYRMDENVDHWKVKYFDNPIYKQFLKEYFVVPCRENRIVFTVDDIQKTIHCKEKESKRGHDTVDESEDLNNEKKQRLDMNGSIIRQTNK